MPNKIRITARKSATTKPIEALHPITGQYQVLNLTDANGDAYTDLTNIPAGNYSYHRVRLQGSSPEVFAVSNTAVTVTDGAATKPKLYLIDGNSIQAYGFNGDGSHNVGFSDANTTPRNRPGDFFFSRVTNAGAKLIVLGYPGYAWEEWIVPGGVDGHNFRQDFADVVNQYKDTYDITAIFALGENGFDRYTAQQQIDAAVTGINFAKSTGVTKILMMPTVNRTDQYSYTVDPAHPYLEVKNQFDQYFVDNATALGIKVAPKEPSADMYADNYPQNSSLCLDQVHPTLIGNKHLARSIAAGAVLFGDTTLAAEGPDPTSTNDVVWKNTAVATYAPLAVKKTGGNNGSWDFTLGSKRVQPAAGATGLVATFVFYAQLGRAAILAGLTDNPNPTVLADVDATWYVDPRDAGIFARGAFLTEPMPYDFNQDLTIELYADGSTVLVKGTVRTAGPTLTFPVYTVAGLNAKAGTTSSYDPSQTLAASQVEFARLISNSAFVY